MDIGCGIPAQYDYINIANASQSPSTIHCRNTNLAFYFRRYLLQKAMSCLSGNYLSIGAKTISYMCFTVGAIWQL